MRHDEPVKRTPKEEKAEKAFLRMGHRPQDPRCDHKGYKGMMIHGRRCPDCGTGMVDFGD